MTTTTTTEVGAVEHEWTYAGQRLAGQKLVHCWLNETGAERQSGKLVGRVVGGVYRVWTDSDDRSVYLNGRYTPVFLRQAEDGARLQWDVEDRHARTRASAKRAEKKAERERELDTVLAPLRERYLAAISSADRAALLALVIQRITR
jgi:hypothetical protein